MIQIYPTAEMEYRGSFSTTEHGLPGLDNELMAFSTRTHLPGITEYSENALKLLGEDGVDINSEIVKFRSGERKYYEGMDHVEALLAINDLRQEDNRPIFLINIDYHDDMNDHIKDQIHIGNWILYADKLNWLHGKKQFPPAKSKVIYMGRQLPFGPARMRNYRETGIDVVQLSVDGFSEEMREIDDYKEQIKKMNDYFNSIESSDKYQLVVSVDLDAGEQAKIETRKAKTVSLYDIPELQELYRKADTLMVFHSPEYTSEEYASEQGKKFREGFMKGEI